MKLMVMIIVSLFVSYTISTVRVRLIHNSLLLLPLSSNITINQSTCNECLCAMLSTTGNSSIVSFNCCIKDIDHVFCQLFTITDYQIFSSYEIKPNLNSTFYFLQLPSKNLLQTTSVDTPTTFQSRVLYFIVTFY